MTKEEEHRLGILADLALERIETGREVRLKYYETNTFN